MKGFPHKRSDKTVSESYPEYYWIFKSVLPHLSWLSRKRANLSLSLIHSLRIWQMFLCSWVSWVHVRGAELKRSCKTSGLTESTLVANLSWGERGLVKVKQELDKLVRKLIYISFVRFNIGVQTFRSFIRRSQGIYSKNRFIQKWNLYKLFDHWSVRFIHLIRSLARQLKFCKIKSNTYFGPIRNDNWGSS